MLVIAQYTGSYALSSALNTLEGVSEDMLQSCILHQVAWQRTAVRWVDACMRSTLQI
jgi:hypothetical protein